MTTNVNLTERLSALQREWRQLNDSLPAHSIPASMLIRLEELEDEINELQVEIVRGNTHKEDRPKRT